ncbi:MAG: trypsin-like peptidase domain-containing protein [Deltaproteobacteria bacterium]|nr:trypsin-like peptidase domain-containing protein [Deltaproteobacteria bacterium]
MRVLGIACAVLIVIGAAGTTRAADPFLRRTPAVRAVEKVGPSVVSITTEELASSRSPFGSVFGNDPTFERFFRDFFEPQAPQQRRRANLGSGVLIDDQGHVLTNAHVVARASRVQVVLADGRELDATVVGADPNNDVAVLQVESDESLPWTPPGDSDDVLVGEPVIAIGNPFGLSNTVTTGVISAVDRSLRTGNRVYHGFLQTDASINPGNSGGPLLNAEGQLIGVNTAIYQGAEGIGFAIPIAVASRVVQELLEHGEVLPVWLGLQFQDLDEPLREAMGLPLRTRGALVTQVRKGGPAARGGVERGDVVTHVDGRAVESAREFYERLSLTTQGQALALGLLRDAQKRSARVVAEEIPGSLVDELASQLLGVELEPLPRGGFSVSKVRRGSGSEQIGLRPGDVILRINGLPLVDRDALERSVLDLRGRERAILVVGRGRGRYHVTIPLT